MTKFGQLPLFLFDWLSPLEKLAVLTQIMLDEGNSGFFMLVHQARTSDNVPDKAREAVEQYSMQLYIEKLLPLIVEGQQAGEILADDPQELLTWYFSVITGLMVLNAQENKGYLVASVKVLLRLLTPH